MAAKGQKGQSAKEKKKLMETWTCKWHIYQGLTTEENINNHWLLLPGDERITFFQDLVELQSNAEIKKALSIGEASMNHLRFINEHIIKINQSVQSVEQDQPDHQRQPDQQGQQGQLDHQNQQSGPHEQYNHQIQSIESEMLDNGIIINDHNNNNQVVYIQVLNDQENQESPEANNNNKRKIDEEDEQVKKKIRIEPGWISWKNEKMDPSAFIQINGKNGDECMKIFQDLREKSLIKLRPFRGIFKQEKCLKMVCFEMDALEFNVAELKKTVKEIEINIKKLKPPKIKLLNIPVHLKSLEEIKREVIKFNNFITDETFTPVKLLEYGNKRDLIVKVSPNVRSEIQENKGFVNLSMCSLKVIDFFDIICCHRCLQVGKHVTKMCINQYRCKICAGWHKMCNKKDADDVKCGSCEQKSHYPFTFACKNYLQKVQIETNKTGYNYEFIMK